MVGGQEDMIVDVALDISSNAKSAQLSVSSRLL